MVGLCLWVAIACSVFQERPAQPRSANLIAPKTMTGEPMRAQTHTKERLILDVKLSAL